MAGLVFHGDAAGRMQHSDAILQPGVLGQQRIQLRFIAVQQELHIGVTLDGFEQSGYDNARAGIAAHGIDRNSQGARHGHLSGERL
jgi:hypothetical protein